MLKYGKAFTLLNIVGLCVTSLKGVTKIIVTQTHLIGWRSNRAILLDEKRLYEDVTRINRNTNESDWLRDMLRQ